MHKNVEEGRREEKRITYGNRVRMKIAVRVMFVLSRKINDTFSICDTNCCNYESNLSRCIVHKRLHRSHFLLTFKLAFGLLILDSVAVYSIQTILPL